MAKSKKALDAVVKDLSLAEFGRKEIELAEHEMPGLMSVRAEFAKTKEVAAAIAAIKAERATVSADDLLDEMEGD